MNVLIILETSNLGGAEKQAIILASCLSKYYAFNCSIGFLDDCQGIAINECNKLNIQYYSFDIKISKKKKLLFDLLKINYHKYQSFKLLNQIRHMDIEILMPYTFLPNILVSDIWIKTKARKCFWNQRDEGRLLEKSHLNILNKATGYISNTRSFESFLIEMNISTKNYYFIENIYIKSIFNSGSKITLNKNHKFVCGMLANIHKYKDHKTLLYAWKKVVDYLPVNDFPLLILAGRIDEGINDLLILSNNLNIIDYIKFIGPVNNITSFYESLDLYVHTSKNEGMSNSILEAMAHNIPVVAYNNISTIYTVSNENIKYLVEEENADDLAEKIILLKENVSIIEKITASNYQKIITTHTEQSITAKYYNILMDIS